MTDVSYIETGPIPDIYVDGVADVELVAGNNVRLILFSWQGGERVVVAKIVRPIDGIMSAYQVMEMIRTKRKGATAGAILQH